MGTALVWTHIFLLEQDLVGSLSNMVSTSLLCRVVIRMEI